MLALIHGAPIEIALPSLDTTLWLCGPHRWLNICYPYTQVLDVAIWRARHNVAGVLYEPLPVNEVQLVHYNLMNVLLRTNELDDCQVHSIFLLLRGWNVEESRVSVGVMNQQK